MNCRVLWLIVGSYVSVGLIKASEGDRDDKFQQCVRNCSSSHRVEGYLGWFWSVDSDCKYLCMRQQVKERRDNGQKTIQYYGKWPFIRIWGIQEPASVVFSILNAVGHVKGWKNYRRIKAHSAMDPYIQLAFYVNLNAWFWSAIFHTRDTAWTEHLDYFSAIALVVYSFYYSLIIGLKLYHSKSKKFLTLAFASFYTYHVIRLVRFFDYGYNMKVSIFCGMCFNLFWIAAYVLGAVKSEIAVKFPMLLMAAAVLEVFDFHAFDFIDGHALWHLATAIIAPKWWQFLIQLKLES